jgi:hypothetical protein
MLIAVMQSYRIGAMSVSASKRMRPSISLFTPSGRPVNRAAACSLLESVVELQKQKIDK